MARPVARPEEPHRRERLLDAAVQAFARSGFAAARLEDIAAAVGVRRASLLHHFASKEALYEAAAGRVFARLAQILAPTPQELQRPDSLVRGVAARFVVFTQSHGDEARMLMRELVGQGERAQTWVRDQVGPLLDRVEADVRRTPGLAADLPVRALLVQLATDALLRASVGELAAPLWGPRDPLDLLDHQLRAFGLPTPPLA